MPFTPIGPNFAFYPNEHDFKRLSRRNERGTSGMVDQIYVDPLDPATIYVISRPVPNLWPVVFRTTNRGEAWTPIVEGLQQKEPQLVDVSSLAINPAHPEVLYISTISGGFYRSPDRGQTWDPRVDLPGRVRVDQLLVDAPTANNRPATRIYAATWKGVYVSNDAGQSWNLSLDVSRVIQIAAHTPQMGTSHFLASVLNVGLYHSTNPVNGWTLLNDGAHGLPKYGPNPPDFFDFFTADFWSDPLNPANIRVYAMMQTWGMTQKVFQTTTPAGQWTDQKCPSPPPNYGGYCFGIVVAPNSPGDGKTDILFAKGAGLWRSLNAGVDWAATEPGGKLVHADCHAVRFFPQGMGGKGPPIVYIGSDGGLGISASFADPAYRHDLPPTEFNAGFEYDKSLGNPENCAHGLQNNGAIHIVSHPSYPALSYIACNDVGILGGCGALGWRNIHDPDVWGLALSLGTDGVKLWCYQGMPDVFRLITDRGGTAPGYGTIMMDTDRQEFVPNRYLAVALDGTCIAGGWPRDPSTKTTTPIKGNNKNPNFVETVGVASATYIVAKRPLFVDGEFVTVQTVNQMTNEFTASFEKAHAMGALVIPQRLIMIRAGLDGIGRQISQSLDSRPEFIGVDPTNADNLYFSTVDQRVFRTTRAVKADFATVWDEVLGANKPNGLTINGIIVDRVGRAFVLLNQPLNVTYMNSKFDTMLYQVTANDWVPQRHANLPPASTHGFGAMAVDPVVADTYYISNGAKVYRVTRGMQDWSWTDITVGLPGAPINSLWIGNIGTQMAPLVLLRVATGTRGAWELDVTLNASEPPTFPYLRANILDLRRLPACPNGVPSPYEPANGAARVWHYQSPDVKIETQQLNFKGMANFFQTEDEGANPLSAVHFDVLKDHSQNLPQMDAAKVHVQVHNRGVTAIPPGTARVWVIYCKASAGVPSLGAQMNGNNFNFWSLFSNNGTIDTRLPNGSPWKSVGPPFLINLPISRESPQVASWNWTIPMLPQGDLGHYCMMAFVHGPGLLISEKSLDADDVATRNPQVAQKNVHIGAPLPPQPDPQPAQEPIHDDGSRGDWPFMREYVEFWNASDSGRLATISIDMRGLPPQLRAYVQFTPLATVQSLSDSMSEMELLGAGERGMLLNRLVVGMARTSSSSATSTASMTWSGNAMGTAMEGFEPWIYAIAASSCAQVRGIQLPTGGHVAMLMAIENTGTLPPGSEYRFHVQQILDSDGSTVGGSMYVVRISGVPAPPETDQPILHTQPMSPLEASPPSPWPPHIRRYQEHNKTIAPWPLGLRPGDE